MLTPDSIVPDPTNPQSFNRYSYSFNNPINYVDPNGHFPEPLRQDKTKWNRTGHTKFDHLPGATMSPGVSDYRIPASSAQIAAYSQAADQRAEQIGFVTRTVTGMVSEPLDWILTGEEILSGEVSGGEAAFMAFFAAAPGLQGSYGDDAVTLFRAVSPDELSDIAQTGIFRPHPGGLSMDAKWFSETLEGAQEWGNRYFDEFEIVSVTIPKDVADLMYRVENLDGFANARAAIDDTLNLLNETIMDLRLIGD